MTGHPIAIDLSDVQRAADAVARVATRTPVVRSHGLSTAGRSVWLKLENLQVTGSFKVRGAAARIAALDHAERSRGIVTCSSGNHGRAVSYVAEQFGISATVCVPEWVDPSKLRAIQRHGAETVVHGTTYDEAEARSREIQHERGLVYVHPFDDRRVIAGQGTIGLELFDQLDSIDTVVVPLSGGGLISGVAVALKALRPGVRVIGASAANASVMYQCLKAGAPQAFPEEDTVANALAGGIGPDNRFSFSLVRDLVDDHVLVSEPEIREAMRFAVAEHGVIAEGGGVVALAAALCGRVPDRGGQGGGNTVLIVSGGNIDPETLAAVLGD